MAFVTSKRSSKENEVNISMLERRLRKNLDWPLLLFTLLLTIVGLVVLYSVTHADPNPAYKKQILWMVLGYGGLIAATWIDYHIYQRTARHFYVVNLLLLTLVLIFAHKTNGAARWIRIAGFEFQPSETAKLFIILTLGTYLARHQETIGSWRTLFMSLGHILVPTLLIFKQPDFGTSLVLVAIWAGMVFMAGADLRKIGALALAGIALFAVVWHSNKIIRPYQKERLTVFLDPEADPSGSGYHVVQARIAIGSGRIWGKGLLHSTQVKGGFIPEKQTDFIFTDIGEELGLVGGILVILIYAGLLWRGYHIIAEVDEDIYGKLVATGVVTMIAFHVVVNIGMNVGIVPVAGVPLPLISAGGSNVLVTLFSIGLLESVSVHRHQLLF
jgi:rod shape determining protein RodA